MTDAEALSTPPNSEGSIQQPQSSKIDCYGDTDGKCSVVTRSGRVSCPNQRFKDYVMTWLKCAITLCSFMYDIHVRWYCAARCLPVFAPVFCYSYVMLLVRIDFVFSTVTCSPLKEGDVELGGTFALITYFRKLMAASPRLKRQRGVVNKDESS